MTDTMQLQTLCKLLSAGYDVATCGRYAGSLRSWFTIMETNSQRCVIVEIDAALHPTPGAVRAALIGQLSLADIQVGER